MIPWWYQCLTELQFGHTTAQQLTGEGPKQSLATDFSGELGENSVVLV